jgi:hypothetical protein
LYARCKSRVGAVLKKRMDRHFGKRHLVIFCIFWGGGCGGVRGQFLILN